MVIERTEFEAVKRSTDDLIDQDEIWIDGAGDTHAIVDMEDEHLVHLRGWLLRSAPQLHLQRIAHAFSFARTLGGDMAIDAMDEEIARLTEANSYVWMEERPLFLAINREIDKRQGVHVCRIIERD